MVPRGSARDRARKDRPLGQRVGVLRIGDNRFRRGSHDLPRGGARLTLDLGCPVFGSIYQDYIENLWYLNLYYANCSMRGKYPAHFCNGIWSFYHDFVPWNSYFHYNMQLAAFPLDAANHPELLNTYCDFRSRQLQVAKEYAEKHKHTRGAFYTDVCDRFGRSSDNTRDNCTCGAQIAMMLYRHYQFTGDEEFLREKALPVMRETALFYLDKFVNEEDRKYHIHGTQCYEGSPLFDDSITDHANAARALHGARGSYERGRIPPLPCNARQYTSAILSAHFLTPSHMSSKPSKKACFSASPVWVTRDSLIFSLRP